MLSVIVPVYNGAHVLPKTVPAMLGQDEPAQWIFVDDGSTDETRSTLEGLIANAPRRDGRTIEVLSHPTNKGRASARNTGVATAGGSLLAFMDADVAPAPGYLSKLVGAMNRPGAVACVARLEMAETDLAQPYHRYLASSKRGPGKSDAAKPLPWKYFLTTASCMRTDVLARAGGFNESISYGEDIELAVRISQNHPDGLYYALDAVARMYDLGSLETATTNMIEFGRDNLPAMVAEYPELARWTGVDVVHSPAGKSLRRVAAGLLLRPGLAQRAHRILPYLPSGLSDYAVRYLLGCTLATSYREGLKALHSH